MCTVEERVRVERLQVHIISEQVTLKQVGICWKRNENVYMMLLDYLEKCE